MAKDWRGAYFVQAYSDYEILLLLRENNAPLCHCLHYLQMATEKLGKGFKTAPGGGPHPNTHTAFHEFFTRIAPALQPLQGACGFKDKAKYSAYLNGLAGVAHDVEKLAPDQAKNGPNPEYPWSDGNQVIAPIEYAFTALDFKANIKMVKLLDFLGSCFKIV